MIDLLQRKPVLTPEEFTESLVPSKRFKNVSFENYQPNPNFSTQAKARDNLDSFVQSISAPHRFRLFRRTIPGRGLYLDGGFGVGKTHLLASAYYAARGQSSFLSFQDLMYLIGALGMERAVTAFKNYHLLLIDEFELDDPGNTHMANTFLGQLMPAGLSVVTTSNTEPGALGQGRFNANDFQRQIQNISQRFKTQHIDGPDYRHRSISSQHLLTEEEFQIWLSYHSSGSFAMVSQRDLNRHLLDVHPSYFNKLLTGVSAVAIVDLACMLDQNIALRFVHFIDKLYDFGIPVGMTGTDLGILFSETYRHGAYAKKYSRCLSRLSELLYEARKGQNIP